MKDGISVIVAVYNVREHLSRCIESLLSQNCKNYEIIIVDDGSTDGSGDILDGYFRENPEKIRLVRQQNEGLSAARNVGLSVARGEYVTFVDGDDYLEKNALTTLYTEIKRAGADIAIAGFFEDFPDFSKEVNTLREELSFERIMEYMSLSDGYKFVVVWGKLYRRSLFSGVEFPCGRIHEDQYIIHKLYYYSKKTVAVGKRLYHHTNRADSISQSSSFSRHMDDIDALFSRSDFLINKGLFGCLIFSARQMLMLLEFYLKYSDGRSDNCEKCRYIKKVARFICDNFGKSSELYARCQTLFLKKYFKYKIFSYIYG
jgi:glycosyltransferase involved in cell wall biosynthesis